MNRDSNPNKARGSTSIVIAGLLFGVVLWILLLERIEGGTFFLHDDNAAYFLLCYDFNFRTLLEAGELAHFNPHQYCGHPHLAQGQSGTLYPPVYLAVALSQWWSGHSLYAIEWLAAMHLLLGSAAMFLWLRHHTVSTSVCVLSTHLYVTLPFPVLVAKSWIFVAYAFAWIPLCFWLIEKMISKFSLATSGAYGIALALFFLQGYVQMVAYYLLFLLLYLVIFWRLGALSWRTLFRRLSLGHLLALFLVLPLLLPMKESLDASAVRTAKLPLSIAISNAVGGQFFPAQLMFFSKQFVFDSGSHILHLGGFVLLSILAVKKIWEAHSCAATPVAPGDSNSVAAQECASHTIDAAKSLYSTKPLLVFGGLFVVALALSTVCHAALSALPIFDRFRWPFKLFLFAGVFYVVIFALIARQLRGHRMSGKAIHGVLLLAIATNVITVLLPAARVPFGNCTVEPASLGKFRDVEFTDGRIAAFCFAPPHGYNRVDSSVLMTHNFATLHRVFAFAGYDPLVLREQNEIVRGQSQWCVFPELPGPAERAHLSHWAVRYWVIPAHPAVDRWVAKQEQLIEVWREGMARMFHNGRARPFASFAHTPESPEPIRATANALLIRPRPDTGKLIVRYVYSKNFRAYDDRGNSLTVAPLDGQIQVTVGQPTEQITLRYVPQSFYRGIAVSAVGIVGLGFLGLIFRRRLAVWMAGDSARLSINQTPNDRALTAV